MTEKYDVLFTPAGELRRLHIYLPDSYNESDERYPVMYFFDGHNLFYDRDATYGKSWGLKEFLEQWGKEMIIVGMECSMTNRLVEYCPYHFTKGFLGEIKGTGVSTIDWIVSELKPLVDSKYRTIPFRECTAIGGSSMGGLMSLYTAIHYNTWFSKAACLSSTIGPCMEDFERDIAAAELFADTRIYLSWGSEEGGGSALYPRKDNNQIMTTRNGEIAHWLEGKGVSTRLFCQEGGHHCEADWEKQEPMFMNYLWMNQ